MPVAFLTISNDIQKASFIPSLQLRVEVHSVEELLGKGFGPGKFTHAERKYCLSDGAVRFLVHLRVPSFANNQRHAVYDSKSFVEGLAQVR